MKYEILLFDLDGTLLDFDKSEEIVLKTLFNNHGISETDSFVKSYNEVNNALWRSYEKGETTMHDLLDTRFRKTMALYNMEIDGEAWEKEYRGYLGDLAFLIDGAEEILKGLHGKHRVFAITNGVGDTQINRLRLCGLIDYFEDIFISQIVGAQKPSKEFFDYVESHIPSFNKVKALVIGDSLVSDILGGINAGIDTCFVNLKNKGYSDKPECTYEINDLSELYKICE